MISKDSLIKTFKKLQGVDALANMFITDVIKVIKEQPEADPWIMCSDRMPEEHDSMFKRFKGTNKWNNAMFENSSDNVNVTIEFENGKRATATSCTVDGKWECEKEYGLRKKVIAWQPLPEPMKKGAL